MILTPAQMIAAEKSAFARGVRAEDLMEIAGRGIASFVRQQFPQPGMVRVFPGKGNNGGDVLVAARHLQNAGWNVELETVFSELGELPRRMLAAFQQHPAQDLPPGRPTVVLDGLLGVGALGAPREPVAGAILRIRSLRAAGAYVVAADVPSGLDAETGGAAGLCVEADATVTIGFAKTGLLADSATRCVGRLAVVSLPGVEPPPDADRTTVFTPDGLREFLPPRGFDVHKGLFGRIALVAGSAAFPGAARLCSEAAVRAGGGLVTLLVPPDIHPVLAAACVPEVMVRPCHEIRALLDEPWDVIALGPGLGRERDAEILEFLERASVPCVVDADALNAVSASGKPLFKNPPAPRILTPHPGEMERLAPAQGRPRRQWAEDFVQANSVTLLLKGSRTFLAQAGHPPAYNSTGHPGMATGGMGDVLTGVIVALLGQRLKAFEAASLGAWVCGRAAELAVSEGEASAESLGPRDVLGHLGRAFHALRSSGGY